MIRLGRISYVNMAPVFYRLDAEVEEVSGVPTDLNHRLLVGEVDIAPISSIEYARPAACSSLRSTGSPRARRAYSRVSSSGRGRLPVWVVRIRCSLRRIALPATPTF